MSISPSCPSCGAAATQIIYNVSAIPVHSCVLLESPEAARSFPKRDLALAYCEACGFAFNYIFDSDAIHYSTDFEESQHFSDTFNQFAQSLAAQIDQKCRAAGKHILEIGCGKGEFLRELCQMAGATGLGIDPAYRFDEGRTSQVPGVDFISESFSPAYEYLDADIVLCRHTLEHIASVSEFVQSIRRMIGSREDVSVVFETPDAKRVLADGAFWDIYYEHCSYFAPGAHARLFRRNGFDVTELELCYDDQYIIQYATLAKRGAQASLGTLENDLMEMRVLADKFPARVASEQRFWRSLVIERANANERLVLWGGGSKAVSFLTTLGLTDEIAAVVDINPYKQGKFTPGTGHPVVPPSWLQDYPPDVVILMNPIYVREVERKLEAMSLSPQIFTLSGEHG